MVTTKRDTIIESSILLFPLLIAFLWMGFLVFDANSISPNVQLSPPRLDSLINALFAFIIIYSIVLFIMFFKNQKSMHKIEEKVVPVATAPPARKKAAKKKKR